MLPLKLADKVAHCSGCRDDFYNRGGNSSDGHCWGLEAAKLRWRWVINMWTPMDRRERFQKVKVHDCFHGEGSHRNIFMKRLPAHLGGDWADDRDRLENELAAAEKEAL